MLLYQFDAAVSRGFYMEHFQKGSGFRGRGSGLARGAARPLIMNESFARMRN